MQNDFHEQLNYSNLFEPQWEEFYRQQFPNLLGMQRVPAGTHDWQKYGVDRILLLPDRQIFVDEKIRTADFGDCLLEINSNLEKRTPGWSIDPSKKSDLIAYAIPSVHKCYLIPFELLRRTVIHNLTAWKRIYPPKFSENNGYTTFNLAIPWPTLAAAMYGKMICSFPRSNSQGEA